MSDFDGHSTFPTYDDYLVWHSRARDHFLEPARSSAVRMLEELLDNEVNQVDRGRFRISTSRVKSAQRSFAKLSGDRYRGRFSTYDEVPEILDDLVGIRLICNNLSDINTFQEVIGELPTDDGAQPALSVERNSQRDYFTDPKPSGYRAFHVNFVVPIAQAQGTKRLRVEVQVRTLLQDGWGELTHEDTYKPGSTVPDWIVRMSLRMADLLAAVDNIAQDLRTGLDVESQKAVEPEPAIPKSHDISDIVDSLTTTGSVDLPIPPADSELHSGLVREARRILESAERPIGLAVLSQDLTEIFGTDITRIWSRSGGFRRFLEKEVPGFEITGPMPGYVHPQGFDSHGWPRFGEAVEGVPDILRELRTYEKTLPLISPERMSQAIRSVVFTLGSAEFTPTESGRVSSEQLAILARGARANGENDGYLVVRPHAQYILLALNRAGRISKSISVEDVESVLLDSILLHLEKSGLVKDRRVSEEEILRWIRGSS
jgi:ppGpp synthetase/RelA/SpoT-type nucleotidyltranferase